MAAISWRAPGRPQASYESLPGGEAPAALPPTAAAPSPPPPRHLALEVPSDREHAIAAALLAHACHEPAAVLAQLVSSAGGLEAGEAAARLATHGPNVIATAGPPPWWALLFEAAVHPFQLILLGLAATAAFTANCATAAIMLLMVSVSTALRFWQELRSTVAAARLTALVTTHATVLRRDADTGRTEEVEVDQRAVVPGDVVRLVAGRLVPADARILTARGLFLGEAALTGESMPVEKHAGPVDRRRRPALFDCPCLAFRGTHVVSGTGLGVVVGTGAGCYISTMADTLRQQKPVNSFQLGVRRVSYLLIAFMACMVPLVMLCSGLKTGSWSQAAVFALAVACGLTPEMLPMIMNANLARGAVSMARQRTIVKRLDAVQNLGAMAILATDKTGTLTCDEAVLTRWLDWRGRESRAARRWAFLNAHFQTGLRNLLDDAILQSGHEEGLREDAARFSLLDELPFDFVRRRLSVVLQDGAAPLLVCKGAVEEMAPLCAAVEEGDGERLPLDDCRRTALLAMGEQLSSEGLRVLAVAVRELPTAEGALAAAAASEEQSSGWRPGSQQAPDTPGRSAAETGSGGGGSRGAEAHPYSPQQERDLTFIGFLAFSDPPKATAAEAVARLQAQSVQIKVLTGDSAAVAVIVCRAVGIPVRGVVTGAELSRLGAADFCAAVRAATVLGRLTPAQKARAVAALKGAGHTVGFLGDGINDALALRSADVGISVDSGSDIAKEAADVILLEKSLLVLGHGVARGRVTHGNTIKYIALAASSNFGNVFSILIASAWLPFQPMRPIQLLTQNLLYDLSQTAIPFDRMDASYLTTPRPWSARGLGTFMACIGPVSSVFDLATFAVLWFLYDARTPEQQALFQTGWFTVGLLTQTLIVHMIRTERVPFFQEVATWPVAVASLLVSAVGLVLPYTPVGRVEGMVQLPRSFYGWVAATVAGYAITVQLAKLAYMRCFGSWL